MYSGVEDKHHLKGQVAGLNEWTSVLVLVRTHIVCLPAYVSAPSLPHPSLPLSLLPLTLTPPSLTPHPSLPLTLTPHPHSSLPHALTVAGIEGLSRQTLPSQQCKVQCIHGYHWYP